MHPLYDALHQHLQASADQGKFSGAVLVASGGEIVLRGGYGMANYELDVPNTPETVFRIGSVTKQFTALAVLQLQERGLLQVSDPLATYLPDFPNAERITLHHLLSHTAGVWNYTETPAFLQMCRRHYTVDELIDTFRDAPLDFEPGEKFSYSNSGYVLLGKVIEVASGQTYEDYLEEHVLGPLGLQRTGMDHGETLVKGRAAGYQRREDGTLENAAYIDMSCPYAAGALCSTVDDLYTWDQALYAGKLLSAASFDQMFQPYSEDGYGYGWRIWSHNGRRLISHSGGVNGFASMILRFVDDRATVIVLSNILSEVASYTSLELADLLFATAAV
ncbi:MAG: beta-lactamase family protein [Alicyclobacillus sp.]|nr:beta-lactamase family protein [Alicyclobacillus sp.]